MQRSRDSDASRHTTTFSSPHQATISLVGGVPGAEKRARYQPFGGLHRGHAPAAPGPAISVAVLAGRHRTLGGRCDHSTRGRREGDGGGVLEHDAGRLRSPAALPPRRSFVRPASRLLRKGFTFLLNNAVEFGSFPS